MAIEAVRPLVEGGRYPAKAALGDAVKVEADAFADGHDVVVCELRFQRDGASEWTWVPMEPIGNDRWRGSFPVRALGPHHFVVCAGVDHYGTWLRDLWARVAADQDVSVELLVGADLLAKAAARATGADRRELVAAADRLSRRTGAVDDDLAALLQSDRLVSLARAHRPPGTTTSTPPCPVFVEPERARFSTWYEMFPRSASADPERPGTLADVIERMGYLERLGVDVLYLPPIHPIGTTGRKGPDGVVAAGPGDPGSPWAIGSPEGGHTAIDPALGTFEDFDALVSAAGRRGMSVALDIAFQCSPDHPWVDDHPEWFSHRPDGSIRFAENPPKRYEDIYPLDFETESWQELWKELLGVVRFWIGRGVTVFRVDNPHTKPFAFWEWLIATVKAEHPEVIFLAEAFTRPKIMNRLAKLGFSQSYTYFAWRNEKWELEQYMRDVAEVADFLRPNFWPNTPDILTHALQTGGTPVFVTRLVLAATLAASYGIYGPAYELEEHVPRFAGSEEYLGSEKYEVRHWDLDRPDSLAELVAQVNSIRRRHPALQRDDTLQVHPTDNDRLLAYSKTWGDDVVLVVVNLDPLYRQSGWVDLGPLGIGEVDAVQVQDLLTGARYDWHGRHNFVILDPTAVPVHVFTLEPGESRPAGDGGHGAGGGDGAPDRAGDPARARRRAPGGPAGRPQPPRP